jgi:hypothetical protein
MWRHRGEQHSEQHKQKYEHEYVDAVADADGDRQYVELQHVEHQHDEFEQNEYEHEYKYEPERQYPSVVPTIILIGKAPGDTTRCFLVNESQNRLLSSNINLN